MGRCWEDERGDPRLWRRVSGDWPNPSGAYGWMGCRIYETWGISGLGYPGKGISRAVDVRIRSHIADMVVL